jgi:hypothetical protein
VGPSITRSKIVEQAVVYAQALAAYHAGFEADPTGDSEYASRLGGVARSQKALTKLNALSPRKGPGESRSCLSADELQAKAKVLGLMYGLKKHEEPNETEKAFIRLFAGEVLDFIAGHRLEVI